MGGEPGGDHVAPPDPRRRQGEIKAEFPRQARQEPAAADIGKEADAGLGHREHRLFRHDPVRAVKGDADAAAHRNAVDQRDIGFGETRNRRVQPVLVGEEVVGRFAALAGFVYVEDIASCREGPALCLDDHQRNAVIFAPCVEGVLQCQNHLVCHSVQRLRPRQRHHARPADALEAYLVAAAEFRLHTHLPRPAFVVLTNRATLRQWRRPQGRFALMERAWYRSSAHDRKPRNRRRT